jgi:glycosyltransferase involved in cell wall biosynthesis
MERSRPLVLHAPSTRWAKGTAAVVPVLEDLHRRGVIDFRLAEGVAPGRMRQFVREADIVIDQLAIGAYGVFACESMAAGKPVIAYLHESTVERIGEPVPIVNATAKTLEESLVALCEDRDRARLIGAESRRYARRLHDGRAAVAVLRDFLES